MGERCACYCAVLGWAGLGKGDADAMAFVAWAWGGRDTAISSVVHGNKGFPFVVPGLALPSFHQRRGRLAGGRAPLVLIYILVRTTACRRDRWTLDIYYPTVLPE